MLRKEAPSSRIIVSYFLLPFVRKLFSQEPSKQGPPPPQIHAAGGWLRVQTLCGWNPDLQGHDFHFHTSPEAVGAQDCGRSPALSDQGGWSRSSTHLSSLYMSQSGRICVFFLLENTDRLAKRWSSRGRGGVGGIAEGERVGPKRRM